MSEFEFRAENLWRQEGKRQHFSDVFVGDTILRGEGRKAAVFAASSVPTVGPSDFGRQGVNSGGLRGADDAARFDAAAVFREPQPDRDELV